MRSRVTVSRHLGVVWLGILAGCVEPAGVETGGPGPEIESPEVSVEFRELGSAPVVGTVAPEDYLVVGWTFAAGPSLRGDLPLEASIQDAPPSARDGLRAVLRRIDEERGATQRPGAVGLESPPRSPPTERGYRLAVGRRWILDLALAEIPGDASRVHVRARVDGRDLGIDIEAGALLKHLRGLAFESLLEAMTRPRIPSAWHFAALAEFLTPGSTAAEPPLPANPAERARLRAEILSFLDESAEGAEVARVLVSKATLFEPDEVARFASASSLPIRLLALTRAAAEGKREPLAEILATSLEYFGEELVFTAALEVLFPRELNAELYALYPTAGTSPTASLAFIQEIRARASKSTFRPGEGWAL